MNIYEIADMGKTLKENTYPGRGIVIGKSADGKSAVIAYFIMGRSENSRNRIFIENGDDVVIHPFDASKVEDPSLIIYSPIRKLDNQLIVTNGDQTDTVYDGLVAGKTFSDDVFGNIGGLSFSQWVSAFRILSDGKSCSYFAACNGRTAGNHLQTYWRSLCVLA